MVSNHTEYVRVDDAQAHGQRKGQTEQTAHFGRRGLRNVNRTGYVHQTRGPSGDKATDEQHFHVIRIADQ